MDHARLATRLFAWILLIVTFATQLSCESTRCSLRGPSTDEVHVAPDTTRPNDARGIGYRSQWALVIGIDKYVDGRLGPPLKHAVNDAREIRDILAQEFGYDRQRIKYLTDEEATKREIVSALTDWLNPTSVHEDDAVLVFMAGHGLNSENRGSRFVPFDAVVDDPTTQVHVSSIVEALDSLPSRHCLLILDFCYAGGLFDNAQTRGDSGVRQLSTSSTNASRRTRGEAFTLELGDSLSYYLSQDAFFGLTAGRQTPVSDGEGIDRHSVFTEALLKTLKDRANSTRDNREVDDIFTFRELATLVESRVATRMGRQQIPDWGRLRPGSGDYVFFPTVDRITPTERAAIDAADSAVRRLALASIGAQERGNDELAALLAIQSLRLSRLTSGSTFPEVHQAIMACTEMLGNGFRASLASAVEDPVLLAASVANSTVFFVARDSSEIVVSDVRSFTHAQRLNGHNNPVSVIATSLDGSILISADTEGSTCIWSRSNSDWTLNSRIDGESPVTGIALTRHNGERLLLARGALIEIRDLSPPHALLRTLRFADFRPRKDLEREWTITALAATPDGRVAVAAADRMVYCFELGEEHLARSAGPFPSSRPIRSMAFDESGARLVIGSASDHIGGEAHILDATNLQIAASFPHNSTPGPVVGIVWRRDLVLLSTGGAFFAWNSSTGQVREFADIGGAGVAFIDGAEAAVSISRTGSYIYDFRPRSSLRLEESDPGFSLYRGIGRLCSVHPDCIALSGLGGLRLLDGEARVLALGGEWIDDFSFSAVATDELGAQLASAAEDSIFVWCVQEPGAYELLSIDSPSAALRFVSRDALLALTNIGLEIISITNPVVDSSVLIDAREIRNQSVLLERDLRAGLVATRHGLELFDPLSPTTTYPLEIPSDWAVAGLIGDAREGAVAVSLTQSTSEDSPRSLIAVYKRVEDSWSKVSELISESPFPADLAALTRDGSLFAAYCDNRLMCWDVGHSATPAVLADQLDGPLVDLEFDRSGARLFASTTTGGLQSWVTIKFALTELQQAVTRQLTHAERQQYGLLAGRESQEDKQ